MTAPKASEVIDCLQWMENDLSAEKEMRDRTEGFHDLFSMRRRSVIPQQMSRGETWDMPSPYLQELAPALLSDLHAYAPSVTLTPKDDTSQTEADRIEKWYAIQVASMMQNWMMTDGLGWHLLVSYGGFVQFTYEDPLQDVPWGFTVPILQTCFTSPLSGAPSRPRYFGRHYNVLVREFSRRYGNNRGLKGAGVPYMRKDGSLGRYELGGEMPVSEAMAHSGRNGWAENVQVYTLDDGEYCSHVAMSKRGGKDGELVWQDKSRAGPDDKGNPAAGVVFTSGMVTGDVRPRDRFLPFCMPGIQYTHQLNWAATIRATKSANNRGDIIEEPGTPEQIEAMARTGFLKATRAQLENGGPNIIPANGPVKFWENMSDEQLDALENRVTHDRDSWRSELREPSDPEVLAQINTNVALRHAESRQKRLQPLLDSMSTTLVMLCGMATHALGEVDGKDVKVYAAGGERYGEARREIGRGEASAISAKDVKDFKKRFDLSVSLSSQSEEQLMAKLRNHKEREAMGFATPEEGLAIAYPDTETQRLRLIEHEAYLETAAALPPAAMVVDERIRLRGGFSLEGLLTPPPPMESGTPNTTPAGPQYQAPYVPGAEGVSEQAVR